MKSIDSFIPLACSCADAEMDVQQSFRPPEEDPPLGPTGIPTAAADYGEFNSGESGEANEQQRWRIHHLSLLVSSESESPTDSLQPLREPVELLAA